MARIRLSTTVLFTLTWLVVLCEPSYACTCQRPGAPCEEYWRADAIFVGTVTGIRAVKVETGYARRVVTLAVSEAFRGIAVNEV